MSIEVAVQAVTLVLAVLAIIWHQQRTTEKLRDDFTQANDRLRNEIAANGQRITNLHSELTANGQRLARIEGFLGVGMPPEVGEQAAGAAILPAD